MTDLADLVRRLRRGADNYSLLNAHDFLEAADALSRLIELERRVKEAPVSDFSVNKDAWLDLGLPDEYIGKRVRLLVVEE